jgi:hypothetical protein
VAVGQNVPGETKMRLLDQNSEVYRNMNIIERGHMPVLKEAHAMLMLCFLDINHPEFK